MAELVYLYRKSGDGGKELRCSLRSLANLKGDHNVTIIGDTEDWLKDVSHIRTSLRSHSPYSDVWYKLVDYAAKPDTPDEFWVMMDDVYFTKKQSLATLYEGELPIEGRGIHKRGLVRTREALNALKKPIRNYDIHVPFKVEKKKLLEIYPHVQRTIHGVPIHWRSFYGNYFDIGGEQYEDKKTRDDELPKGSIISTLRFTPQLEKKFKKRSKYENDAVLVYSNTEPNWQERHKRIKRENGANTYTREILEYQIPLWRKYLDEAVISTTARLSEISNVRSSKVYVQYLHEYPKHDPLRDVQANIEAGFTNAIYVVSYKELHKAITEAGHTAIWIPMTIDPQSLPEHQPQDGKRIIYYGNVLPPKQETYTKLKDFFESNGWKFHTISKGYYSETGGKLTQEQCWDIIKGYQYGIGVGRSYMEMSAIGLKCIVAGHSIGGITKTKAHHEKQVSTNYNTNLFTFSDDLEEILENLDKVKPRYESIHDNLEFIEKQIKAVLNSDD